MAERHSPVMRLLLLIADETARLACTDFFEASGCNVDTAEDAHAADGLLRFRSYDLVLADLPTFGQARAQVLDVVRRARGSEVRVLLTTGDPKIDGADDSVIVLTKPQRLDAILGIAAAARVAARTAQPDVS